MNASDSSFHDIVVIGAGICGLKTASDLIQNGRDVIVLEARDRLGGRILESKTDPQIELGAEFIHGTAHLTKKILREKLSPFYSLNYSYLQLINGKVRATPHFWERIAGVLSKIKLTHKDVPFQEFLKTVRGVQKEDKELAASFVQGFNAAEIGKLSSHAMKRSIDQVKDPQERMLSRPLDGYGSLVHEFGKAVQGRVRLESVVQKVDWRPGEVTIHGLDLKTKSSFRLSAQRVITTVPVGVLKATSEISFGAIEFNPRPAGLYEELEHFDMGQIVRLVIELQPHFFQDFPQYENAMIAAPEHHFTAWWSSQELDGKILMTAWAGGEKAMQLVRRLPDEHQRQAVADLAFLCQTTPKKIQSYVIGIHEHDWTHDPYAMGAYSYPVVHSDPPPSALKQSWDSTIYFAGELFDTDHPGTVEGALSSAEKTVAQIMNQPLLRQNSYEPRQNL